MLAVVTRVNYQGAPQSVLALGFSAESKVHVSASKEYRVWAAVSWRSVLFFLVINDLEYPDWLPAWLFKLTDKTLSSDWICCVFGDGSEMIHGPRSVAESQEAYQAMV